MSDPPRDLLRKYAALGTVRRLHLPTPMNRETLSRSALAACGAALAVFLFGCTGGGSSNTSVNGFSDYRGAASFNASNSLSLLVSRADGYQLRKMDAPYGSTTEIGRIDQASFGSQYPPTFISEAGGQRAVAAGILDGAIYDLNANGATAMIPTATGTTTLLDADFASTGEGWSLIQPDYTLAFYEGAPGGGSAWTLVAGSTDASCAQAGASMVVEGNGNPVGFCGGEILTLGTGADLVVTTNGTVNFSFAADGARDAGGSAVFFYLAAGSGGTELHQLARDVSSPTGWTASTLVASVPGVAYQGSHLVAAADATRVAILDRSCGNTDPTTCPGELYEARQGLGGSWSVEDVGPVASGESSEGLTAGGDAIAIGSITLTLWQRNGNGTWSPTVLGHVGQKSQLANACSVVNLGDVTTLTGAVPALLLLAFFYPQLRKRRK